MCLNSALGQTALTVIAAGAWMNQRQLQMVDSLREEDGRIGLVFSLARVQACGRGQRPPNAEKLAEAVSAHADHRKRIV
jgi:hypothetical protein